MHRILRPTLDLQTDGNGLIAPEAFSHVHHPALALAVALFQLLASGGQAVDERGAQAVRGFVAFHQHAVRLLQAERKCGSWVQGCVNWVRVFRAWGIASGGGGLRRTDVFAGAWHGEVEQWWDSFEEWTQLYLCRSSMLLRVR